MNFDKIVTQILEGYGYRPTGSGRMDTSSQSYRKAHGADYDQDAKNFGGNSDTKQYWTVTKPNGTKKYFTKKPTKTFPGESVDGPFRGNPPR